MLTSLFTKLNGWTRHRDRMQLITRWKPEKAYYATRAIVKMLLEVTFIDFQAGGNHSSINLQLNHNNSICPVQSGAWLRGRFLI